MSAERDEMIDRSEEGLEAFKEWKVLLVWILAIGIQYFIALVERGGK